METCNSANTGPEVQSMFLVKPLVPRLEDVATDPQLILATVKPQVPLLEVDGDSQLCQLGPEVQSMSLVQ